MIIYNLVHHPFLPCGVPSSLKKLVVGKRGQKLALLWHWSFHWTSWAMGAGRRNSFKNVLIWRSCHSGIETWILATDSSVFPHLAYKGQNQLIYGIVCVTGKLCLYSFYLSTPWSCWEGKLLNIPSPPCHYALDPEELLTHIGAPYSFS